MMGDSVESDFLFTPALKASDLLGNSRVQPGANAGLEYKKFHRDDSDNLDSHLATDSRDGVQVRAGLTRAGLTRAFPQIIFSDFIF